VNFSFRFIGLAMQSSASSSRPVPPRDGSGPETRLLVEAETELARQIQAGDQRGFETLYDRFAPGLFSMIYAVLRDQKESEDVLQESFVQMWKGASTYDPNRSSLSTWAVMISRYKAIDRLRSRPRQSRLAEAVAQRTDNSADLVEGKRADNEPRLRSGRERVCAAMEKLQDGQREAIELAFFAGLTQTQIAEKIGAPLGTMKARIRRGLLALREELKGVSP
jgi:RNA polymerase sigma-70 factor (ECF subfamily)